MAIPLSLYDQMVYDAGYQYIPQSQYLLTPFKIPTELDEDEVKKPVTPVTPVTPTGISTLYPPQGGGSNNALQVGNINFDDFNRAGIESYQRRQPTPLIDDLYQSKIDETFFGFPSYREQDLTGPDMGEYIASDTDIPLELTTAGKLQSALGKFGKGITGLISKAGGIGPVSMALGAMDKFDTLPELDQQFINQSMGYRGPTVFGENTGGGYVDPFGVNVRSAFGNYAEKVRDDYSSLKDSLTGRLSDKYDATFDEELGEFVGKGAKKANDMTEMMRKKFSFRNKQINQQKFDKKIADLAIKKQRDLELAAKRKRDMQAKIAAEEKARKQKESNDRIAREAATAARARAANPNVYARADQLGFTDGRGGGFGSRSTGTNENFSNKTGRGRTGYVNGGIVDMLILDLLNKNK
jgi:hypothetical protein